MVASLHHRVRHARILWLKQKHQAQREMQKSLHAFPLTSSNPSFSSSFFFVPLLPLCFSFCFTLFSESRALGTRAAHSSLKFLPPNCVFQTYFFLPQQRRPTGSFQNHRWVIVPEKTRRKGFLRITVTAPMGLKGGRNERLSWEMRRGN